MRVRTFRVQGGFTLLELCVVLGICAVLIGMIVPAVQRARSAADRATCANNLHQIGIAEHSYQDANRCLPAYRLCPDLADDPQCNCLPDPEDPSGPNEKWWAPFDARVGMAEPPMPGFDPSTALIWPYIEGNQNVFRCPLGVDPVRGSPTWNQPLQVSYAMNAVTGGPSGVSLGTIVNGAGTSNVMLAWDHAMLPGCSTISPCHSRLPWPFEGPDFELHYPQRHLGTFNVLFCDGHIVPMQPANLQTDLFYVNIRLP